MWSKKEFYPYFLFWLMMTFMVPLSRDDVGVIAGLSCQDSSESPCGLGFLYDERSPVAPEGPCGPNLTIWGV